MTACEDHVKDCKILTQFNVEPEENWILYHGGKGEVVHGKAKPKMFGKYETWITNDKQIRDPHACLAKDQVCKVSIFRLYNSWQGSTLTLKSYDTNAKIAKTQKKAKNAKSYKTNEFFLQNLKNSRI